MFIPIFLALIIGYLSYKLTARPPNFPKGPVNLPFIGYLPFLGRYPYLGLRKLSDKYGDIFSINMGSYRAIVLSSYELIRDAFKEETFSGRPPLAFLRFMSEGKGLLFSEGHVWQETRRFTLRHLKEFGIGKSSLDSVIQEEIRELTESHKRNIGKAVMLDYTFNLAVVNALWTIVTGERYDLSDPQAVDAILKTTQTINTGSSNSFIQLVPFMAKLVGFPDHVLKFVEDSKARYRNVIEDHRKAHEKDDRSDFIHVYLSRMRTDEKLGKQTPFTGEDGLRNLTIIIMDLFIAGSETTSTTLLWVFLFLTTYPDIQEKVHQELDSVVGKERMPSSDDRIKMPYTEAVLMECQRFASLVPLGLTHYCTKDTEFRGYVVPKGTMIISNLHQIMRDPRTWERPDEFYPEHFLTKDGKVKYVEQMVPFSTGKRVCLGESLAKMQLFLFTTSLLQQFKFTFPDDQPKPTLVPPPAKILRPAPYHVTLTLRK